MRKARPHEPPAARIKNIAGMIGWCIWIRVSAHDRIGEINLRRVASRQKHHLHGTRDEFPISCIIAEAIAVALSVDVPAV